MRNTRSGWVWKAEATDFGLAPFNVLAAGELIRECSGVGRASGQVNRVTAAVTREREA